MRCGHGSTSGVLVVARFFHECLSPWTLNVQVQTLQPKPYKRPLYSNQTPLGPYSNLHLGLGLLVICDNFYSGSLA